MTPTNPPHHPGDRPAELGGDAPLPGRLAMKDMLELASLDAMGMLDDDHRRAFDATFRSLPEPARAHLRAEQARFAEMTTILPEVTPAPELGDRVVDAVSAEAAAENDILGRLGQLGPVESVSAPRVHRVWRATAIAGLAAAMAFGVTVVYLQSSQRQQFNAIRTDQTFAVLTPLISQLANPNSDRITFAADGGQGIRAGVAVLFVDRQTRKAQLACWNLPESGGQYSLVITSGGSPVSTVATFRASGAKADVSIPRLDLAQGQSLSIVPASGTGPALSAQNL